MTITEAAACGDAERRHPDRGSCRRSRRRGDRVPRDWNGRVPARDAAGPRRPGTARPTFDGCTSVVPAPHVGSDGARDPRGAGCRVPATTSALVTASVSANATSRHQRLGYVALALLAYVPVILSAPGKVAADTKQYLYLDPVSGAGAGVVHVGPEHRFRDGDPPEHRLPVPARPVLLAHRSARSARLGRPAALAGVDSVRRRARACCSCSVRSGCAGPAPWSARSRSC